MDTATLQKIFDKIEEVSNKTSILTTEVRVAVERIDNHIAQKNIHHEPGCIESQKVARDLKEYKDKEEMKEAKLNKTAWSAAIAIIVSLTTAILNLFSKGVIK